LSGKISSGEAFSILLEETVVFELEPIFGKENQNESPDVSNVMSKRKLRSPKFN